MPLFAIPIIFHRHSLVCCLGIGKHVSVQPPAALGQNETLRMVQAAQYYPALLSVRQFHIVIRVVKFFVLIGNLDMIDRG